MKIGEYNKLKIARFVDFGAYLEDADGNEVLLPARYIDGEFRQGDMIDVFVYTDSEDRPVATTERPFVTSGEFAFLEVADVNSTGAFLDWGLPKNLLVPYKEQKSRMRKGGVYLVYVYTDKTSGRVAASAKIEKFLGNKFPAYVRGDKVKALVYAHEEPGYRVIVDNLYQGMIYENDLFKNIEIGQTMTARVNKVRDDGKIDLVPGSDTGERVRELAEKFYYLTDAAGGQSALTDDSTPAEIKTVLQCSKKDFKKAVGFLLKNGLIKMEEGGITLIAKWDDKVGSSAPEK